MRLALGVMTAWRPSGKSTVNGGPELAQFEPGYLVKLDFLILDFHLPVVRNEAVALEDVQVLRLQTERREFFGKRRDNQLHAVGIQHGRDDGFGSSLCRFRLVSGLWRNLRPSQEGDDQNSKNNEQVSFHEIGLRIVDSATVLATWQARRWRSRSSFPR